MGERGGRGWDRGGRRRRRRTTTRRTRRRRKRRRRRRRRGDEGREGGGPRELTCSNFLLPGRVPRGRLGVGRP
eukprot:1315696-Pyramimonas_sp.AAC.2